jgi:hypothetical protein
VIILLVAASVILYFLLALAWFDHGIETPLASLPPAVLAVLLGAVLAVLIATKGVRRRFPDRRDGILLVAVFFLAVASRVPFLDAAYGLFSSDSAIHGVMALHVLEGKHHPVFAYGESYDGGLKAHLTALIALFTREPVQSFALESILMYAVFVSAVFALARTTLDRGTASMAAAYAILSPGFITAWSVKNDGSYVEVLAFGTMALAVGARFLKEEEGRNRRSFSMGVLNGLAFWSHVLGTYYLVATALILLGVDRSRRSLVRLGLFSAGFVLGNAPALLWNYAHDWLTFRWWGADVTPLADRGLRGGLHVANMMSTSFPILTGWWPMDLPPAWHVARIVLFSVFPAAALVFALRERAALSLLLRGRLTPQSLLIAFFLLVVFVFAASSHGWLTEDPRYLIFLFSVVPIFLASALVLVKLYSRAAAWVLGCGLLALNLCGSGVYLLQALESAELNSRFVREVEDLGVRYAHTDYYISYKYNFLSHGRLVFSSALGPARTERYAPFREEVMRAERVALVPRSFGMARRIGARLDARHIPYRRKDLLYPVILDLGKDVARLFLP